LDSSASLTVFLSFATLECVPMFYIRLKAWDCSGKGQVGRLEWEEGSRPGGGQTEIHRVCQADAGEAWC
jgi:hypothetical protein